MRKNSNDTVSLSPAAGAKAIWIYRSGYLYADKQIVLYEYQKTRNASHPRKFLEDFKGICVTDGYQVYHTIENEQKNTISLNTECGTYVNNGDGQR